MQFFLFWCMLWFTFFTYNKTPLQNLKLQHHPMFLCRRSSLPVYRFLIFTICSNYKLIKRIWSPCNEITVWPGNFRKRFSNYTRPLHLTPWWWFRIKFTNVFKWAIMSRKVEHLMWIGSCCDSIFVIFIKNKPRTLYRIPRFADFIVGSYDGLFDFFFEVIFGAVFLKPSSLLVIIFIAIVSSLVTSCGSSFWTAIFVKCWF